MANKHTGVLEDVTKNGAFERKPTTFRNFVTADGSSGFKAEEGRYHLYVSLACPWAHRTLIVRQLKGLEHVISYDVVDWLMGKEGWTFARGDQQGKVKTIDTVNGGKDRLRQVYEQAQPGYEGRITVPVLWDKKQGTIVNNESSEIIRMLNSEFNQYAKHPDLDLYPQSLRTEIDAINDFVYPNVNNGVYRCGFATTQQAYEEAYESLFKALDTLEDKLSKQRYLVGSQITEADVRLFTTLVRFDPVYVGHFKCNKKCLREYPSLINYLKDLYQHGNIADTVDFTHIKHHYYVSHTSINPTGVVPKGPEVDYTTPHNRNSLK